MTSPDNLAKACATLPARAKPDNKGLSGPLEPTLRPCGDLGQRDFSAPPQVSRLQDHLAGACESLPARSKPDSKGLSGVSKPTLRPCDDLGQEKFLCTPYQVSRLQGDLARPCATLPARIKLDGKGLSGPSEPTLRPCGDLGQENFFRTPPKLAVRRTTPVFLSTEYSLLHKSRVQKRVLVRISFCLGGQRWM